MDVLAVEEGAEAVEVDETELLLPGSSLQNF
jgi:hypothetical protein